jgi:hypothetical protein
VDIDYGKSTEELTTELLDKMEEQLAYWPRDDAGRIKAGGGYADLPDLIPQARAGDRDALDRVLSIELAGLYYRLADYIRTRLRQEAQ